MCPELLTGKDNLFVFTLLKRDEDEKLSNFCVVIRCGWCRLLIMCLQLTWILVCGALVVNFPSGITGKGTK